MKKIYVLLFAILISKFSFGQSVLFYEGFDDASQYTVSIPEQIVNQGAYFTRTDGTNITNNLAWGSGDFNYFTAQDLDTAPMSSPATMTFSGISISGKSDITFGIALAESDALDGFEDWDNDDFLHIEYQIDGGSWVNLIWIESSGAGESAPQVDTNFNGDGDGAIITNDFEEDISAAIPNAGGTGSMVNIKLTFGGLKEAEEDIVIEQLYIVNNLDLFPNTEITNPAYNTTFVPGTSSVDVEFTTENPSNIDHIDALVNDVLTSNISSPFTVSTTNGSDYTVEILVYMNGFTDFPVSDNDVFFNIAPLTQVTNIDQVRADVIANGDLGYYEITGECTITHTDATNGRQYIQDPITNTGLLIYEDGTGLDIPFFTVGENVSGLKGQAKFDSNTGLLLFVPFENSGLVQSSGNLITPQTTTINNFNSSIASKAFESELIKFENVTFDSGNGSNTFFADTNYGIQDTNFDSTNVFTTFAGADYIGQVIPSLLTELVAIGGEDSFGFAQVYVRSLGDFTLNSKSIEIGGFSMYPNPTSLDYVNIASKSNSKLDVSVFDTLGKQVLHSTVNDNKLDVSKLNTGIYVLKVSQDDAITTKKLMVQ